MAIKQPQDISQAFQDRFNARDEAALLSLYAEDAVFSFDNQEKHAGLAAIKTAMAGFLASPLKMESFCAACHISGDIALVRSEWRLKGPDGSLQMQGASAEVLRRGADGLWRFIIDDATMASRAML